MLVRSIDIYLYYFIRRKDTKLFRAIECVYRVVNDY